MTARLLVRRPAVAGSFYPAAAERLAEAVDGHLEAATSEGPQPRALAVPHAGYVYSGPVAGSGYRLVRGRAPALTRVLLLGPAHYVPVRGLAVSSADAFATPLGLVPMDTSSREWLLEAGGGWVVTDDDAHAPEHSLEVQLPFLQRSLGGDVHVLPVVVGHAPAEVVAGLLAPWWDDPAALVVVSSDLSHYESYEVARRLDERTAAAVVGLDAESISDRDACGAYPLRGLVAFAARRSAAVRLLDLRSSGDTAGPRDRVVGYGAFAFGAAA